MSEFSVIARRTTLAVLAAALLSFSPGKAFAGLVSPVTLTWYYPNATTIESGPEGIAVGSTLTCNGQSGGAICNAYGGASSQGQYSFAVGTNSITYTGVNAPGNYLVAAINTFDFSALSFGGGGSLSNYDLSTNIAGLTKADVTFGSSFIEVNMSGLPANGTFTLTLNPVPEPSALLPLWLCFVGLLGYARRRALNKSIWVCGLVKLDLVMNLGKIKFNSE